MPNYGVNILFYCIVQNRFRKTRFRLGQKICPQEGVLGSLYRKLDFALDFGFEGVLIFGAFFRGVIFSF